ncbi:MAG TPA: DnaJ domain-containing protein [Candidatus Limnocylindrales bacterium]|nr:DnaJ domain-containing protein [Candidatus Limnocylindrales bacterium]
MSLAGPDPYRVLGIGRDAGPAEIKAAHRSLAKRYHPDAPEADTRRFLAVQRAYQLLRDPLARREWDAAHAPGPVRPDGGAPRAGRPAATPGPRGTARGTTARGGTARGTSDAPRPTRGPRPTGPSREPGRPGWTWSARDVPWWEDPLAPREARRPPGRQRPREGQGAGGEPGTASAPGQGAGTRGARGGEPGTRPSRQGAAAPRRDPASGQRGSGGPQAATEGTGPASMPPEMDVYSRSSGAAWSSAARAYFRRHDLPPPGRRSAWPAGRQETGEQASGGATQGIARSDATRSRPAPRPRAAAASTARARTPAGGSARGVTFGPAGGPARTAAAAVAAEPSRPAKVRTDRPWPTPTERVTVAVLGWLPLAVGIAYGGGAVSGCGSASFGCPDYAEPLQGAAILGALLLLLVLPRIGWLAAAGTVGLGAASVALLSVYALVQVPQPMPEPYVLLAVVVGLSSYLFAAWQAARDRPLPRPWARTG